jgi:hypothetical protein
MPKSLNDVLKGVKKSTTKALTTGENPGVDYADKMKDSRDFVAQHSVEKHDDRVGNGDDVYQATNVKKAEMKNHGHEPKPKDIKIYNKNQQVGQSENVKEEAVVEAKCNMSEAGTKCEVHGNKACPKDESAENDEPRFSGKKDKAGKPILITDKKNIQEKLTKKTPVGKIIKDFQQSDDPRFKGDSPEKRKERALATWYKLHPEKSKYVDEGFLDQRSKKTTTSEEARKKIASEMTKKKEKEEDFELKKKEKLFDSDLRKQEIVFNHKLRNGKGKSNVKEQSAPAETPITFPATNSREGLKV